MIIILSSSDHNLNFSESHLYITKISLQTVKSLTFKIFITLMLQSVMIIIAALLKLKKLCCH